MSKSDDMERTSQCPANGSSVGKFLVAALINSSASRNETLIVHSFTATPNEIVAEYEEQTGVKWEKKYTTVERLKEIEKEEYQVYSPLATVVTLRRIWTEGGTLHKFYDEAILGVGDDCESLQSQVAANIIKQQEGEGHFPSLLRKLSLV